MNPFQISLETLAAVSPLLGHRLEDRSSIRASQDRTLLHRLQQGSTAALANVEQQTLFSVAPLDILVSECNGRKQFHIIELNGTGIGGLTNMTEEAVGPILEGLAQWGEDLARQDPQAVILIASSGKEDVQTPRMNKLIHEKVLYAEALRQGFERAGLESHIVTMPQLLKDPQALLVSGPTVVLGYIKDFLEYLRVEEDGRLSLFTRPVTGGINDRFCLNVLHQFGPRVDLASFQTMNRCFLPGADKGVAYSLLNEYREKNPHPAFPERVEHARASNRQELISVVLSWLEAGRKPVIKPQGTGLGHGIEFFLSADEPVESIIARIDSSLELTERFYRTPGGAFPYTVCELIDTCTIRKPSHPLDGHKYELRVVVYRDGMELKAFPSIIKVSGKVYDAANPDRMSLINNITTSAEACQKAGTELMLPLCNQQTLDLIGLAPEDLEEVCAFATGYVRSILDCIQTDPERLGLPAISTSDNTSERQETSLSAVEYVSYQMAGAL